MNVIMVVKESAAREIMVELSDVLSAHDIFVKVEKDYIFNSMFDINTEKVDVDINDSTFLALSKEAHERNITLNELVTELLMKKIDSEKFINVLPKEEKKVIKNDDIHCLIDELLRNT